MKILLYTEFEKLTGQSGLGKAIRHQMRALEENGIEYTKSPKEAHDIIHINYYGLRSYHLAKKEHRKGGKVVYHAHSTEEDFKNSFIFSNLISPLFKKWICKCYSQGDAIITPTPYSKRLLEGYGLKNITAISNGIDLSFFCPDKEAGERFREKYGFGKEDKVVVGIGLYLERKGILDFVEMSKRLPQYKFIWFGHTNLAIVPRKIRKAVKTRLPNLQFPGYVEPSGIKEALNGADLYWFPTHEETEGIPAMEACACGQKTLVRNIPVFEGWLIDGVNTYMADSVDGFEQKICDILEGRLPPLTGAGFEVARSREIHKVGREMIDVYRRVLGQESGTDNAGAFKP
ncbi:MAG: glycosyltransferase family 4 protein [Clostridia bacterium]|nr:glycosyltransferase family 4 protein [Clostridia bacterium]